MMNALMHRRRLLVVLLACFVAACATFRFPGGDTTEDVAPGSTGEGEVCEGAGCEGTADEEADAPDSPLLEEPAEVTTEEIEFVSGEVTLKGTLYSPKTESESLPGVLLVHDWGPQGREGIARESFGVQLPLELPVYKIIAEELAARGVATMVYDKRTCVEGTAPWCGYPRTHVEGARDQLGAALLADAKAGLEALRAHARVADDNLHVIGHGHGADIALNLVGEPSVESAVLLSPSPYPVDVVIQHQTEASIEAVEKRLEETKGTAEGDLLKAQLEELERLQESQPGAFEAIRSGEDPDDSFGLTPSAWRGMFDLHDRAMDALEKTEKPIFAVMGELDLGIPADSIPIMESKFEERQDRSLLILPDLTHLLVDVGEGSDPTVLSEDVIDALLAFYDQHA